MVEVAGPLPGKIIFCPQNDKFGCILMQFLTGRKHGQSLEALRHGFYCSIAKQSLLKQCKNYPKNSWSDQRGRAHNRPAPEYVTG